MIHPLKTWPKPFEATWIGYKHAEYRKDDRGFHELDKLRLEEFDPETQTYTGRSIRVQVTDIQRGPDWGIPEGYVLMSFTILSREDRRE